MASGMCTDLPQHELTADIPQHRRTCVHWLVAVTVDTPVALAYPLTNRPAGA
jgi:hypothetical protein